MSKTVNVDVKRDSCVSRLAKPGCVVQPELVGKDFFSKRKACTLKKSNGTHIDFEFELPRTKSVLKLKKKGS